VVGAIEAAGFTKEEALAAGKVVGYPPLVDTDDWQRREFDEALLDADSFEDLPGKWQAAILKSEAARPRLRVVEAH